MNALAEDQLGRLRALLAGTGITFGMYVGKTPERESEVTGIRLPPGASRADYEARAGRGAAREAERNRLPARGGLLARGDAQRRQPAAHPAHQREAARAAADPPARRGAVRRRPARLPGLRRGPHLHRAQGAETACLIRRLRAFCGREAQDTVCIATSATIVDKENPEAARDFASRFFGVPSKTWSTVGEAYESEVWADESLRAAAPAEDAGDAARQTCVQAVEDEPIRRLR